MSLRLEIDRRFKQDLKLLRRRGYAIEKLDEVVARLRQGLELPERMRPHRLSGRWAGFWECRIENDWLMIWEQDAEAIRLVRTGTHTDVLGI